MYANELQHGDVLDGFGRVYRHLRVTARTLEAGDTLEVWGIISRVWKRQDGRIRFRTVSGDSFVVPEDHPFILIEE